MASEGYVRGDNCNTEALRKLEDKRKLPAVVSSESYPIISLMRDMQYYDKTEASMAKRWWGPLQTQEKVKGLKLTI